ncbi:hypothetical protein AVEN_125501-1 [Araneus ventricosus]|uniref:Uncharacterized protein n=1 Tax=Araneus ventricosus TaxID=182803 RepID=A0A4Y2IFC5_ARAVE|nr:hypothetical protein AVEN_125501-1 [Araneus ventricosus]
MALSSPASKLAADELKDVRAPRRSLVDPTHSVVKRSPYIVYPAGRDVTRNDLAHSWRIFSLIEISKIPAPLRYITSPRSGSDRVCCRSSHTYPVKLSLAIR